MDLFMKKNFARFYVILISFFSASHTLSMQAENQLCTNFLTREESQLFLAFSTEDGGNMIIRPEELDHLGSLSPVLVGMIGDVLSTQNVMNTIPVPSVRKDVFSVLRMALEEREHDLNQFVLQLPDNERQNLILDLEFLHSFRLVNHINTLTFRAPSKEIIYDDKTVFRTEECEKDISRGVLNSDFEETDLDNECVLHNCEDKINRRLDAIARLIHFHSKSAADTQGGRSATIALGLLKGAKREENRFVIACKTNIFTFDLDKALTQISHKAKKILESHDSDTLKIMKKEKKETLKSLIEQVKNPKARNRDRTEWIKQFVQVRKELDFLKIASLIRCKKGNPFWPIAVSLKFGERNILIENKERVHPELLIVDYFRENNIREGYIGLSMLNCFKCKIALHGGHGVRGINQAGFKYTTRGSFDISYPNTRLVSWFKSLNPHMNADMLSEIGDEYISHNEPFHCNWLKQIQPLSESDEE